MTTVDIPEWNTLGLLPPIDPVSPASQERSPYRVALPDVVARFSTSSERRQILRGWLNFRAALHDMGIVEGFQWLDGSFMEQVEVLERRAPRDIDIVSFVRAPAAFNPTPEQLAALDHDHVKQNFLVDSYLVEMDQLERSNLIRKAAYWYSMWSHRRNQAWKGYLEVDLDPAFDQQALDLLAQQEIQEAQP